MAKREQRTLRSKRLRAALWVAAGGKCQRCSAPIGPGFHADHELPWSVIEETNVHGMQALCERCNLEKGANGLRRHQAELTALFREVEAGIRALPPRIGAYVCCGGGKQGLAGLFAHWTIERLAVVDAVCWVTPNSSLRRQAAESLLPSRWLARATGHHLKLYESINSLNPSKDGSGYVITRHALVDDRSGINRQEFHRRRYALVIDEAHHFPEDSPSYQAIRPLLDQAEIALVMTGTLDRGDQKPVALWTYGADNRVDTNSRDDFWWVRYPISDATRDRAIIEADFTLADGAAEWRENGEYARADEFGDNRRAVFTALRTGFADTLLDDCHRQWLAHRRVNPRAKHLIVCADIRQARRAVARLEKGGSHRVAIATSDQKDEADENIRRFQGENLKPGEVELDELVTVAMAYEGLDAPSITHISCLTHIRSRPWIEQMVGRAWRYDPAAGPWHGQKAYIWAPADDAMRAAIRHIRNEQELVIKSEPGPPGPSPEPFIILPTASEMTDIMAEGLDGVLLDAEQTDRYRWIADQLGRPDLSPLDLHRLEAEIAASRERQWTPRSSGAMTRERRPQEEWDEACRELDVVVGAAAKLLSDGMNRPIGECKREINLELIKHFNKRRGEQTVDELGAAARWVKHRYGLED